jgi:hypothetical protein
MEQITNCILMEYQYKEVLALILLNNANLPSWSYGSKYWNPLIILTDGWMNFAFGKWN